MTSQEKTAIDACKDQAAQKMLFECSTWDEMSQREYGLIPDDAVYLAMKLYGEQCRIKALEEAVLCCEEQGDYTHDVLRQYVLAEKAKLTAQA